MQVRDDGLDPFKTTVVVDAGGTRLNCEYASSPCLTASRCSQKGFWLTNRQRHMIPEEMMALQGMDPAQLAGWRDIIPETQMGHIIGNAVPIPLMTRVLQMLLYSIGCLAHGP